MGDVALATFERAIAQGKIGETTAGLANAYFYSGYIYQAIRKDITATLQAYNQALALNLEDAAAYNNRGVAYADVGEYDRAIADYDQALARNPEYAVAYNNRGSAYAHKGEYDRAIADYDQAIALDPEDAEFYENRGNAYKELGEKEKAIADFEKYLELADDPYWQEKAKQQLEELRGE